MKFSRKRNTIVLTGGGTAGHILPNIALAPELKKNGFHLIYIGSSKEMDKTIVTSFSAIPFFGVSSGKFRRYVDIKNIFDMFSIIKGFFQAFFLLIKIKPCLTFSKGGFVSVPVVLASWLLKIPVVLHESDISPGLANRILIPLSKAVCLSFEESLAAISSKKARLTGIPVRPQLLEGDPSRGRLICSFNKLKPILLICGGSQGSRIMDEFIWKYVDRLLERYQIAHIGSRKLMDPAIPQRAGYSYFEFVKNDLAHLYACSDVIVSRSGANTLFELLSLKKLMLLIPLPTGTSRGEQIENAKAFHRKKLCKVLFQEELDFDRFVELIATLLQEKNQFRLQMELNCIERSGEKITEIINSILKK